MLFARKWIGGETIQEVIAESRRINGAGEKVIINYLGEDYSKRISVKDAVDTYIRLISQMRLANINGDVAIKPTQLGLNISYALFLSNYKRIVQTAEKDYRFVWMDMEDYMFVDESIKAYLDLLKRHKNIGICIQSRLIRSFSDAKRIVKAGGIIRLVKGAYPARKGVSYLDKADTDRNYVRCMEYLFNNSKKFMLATHDERIIDRALRVNKRRGTIVLFGMLRGIRGNLAKRLAGEGERMYVYVPFGPEWLEYSVRRLRELEHSMLIIRSIISG